MAKLKNKIPDYIRFQNTVAFSVDEPTADEIQAAGVAGEKPLPKFKMDAYTGKVIRQWFGDTIIDLDGLKADISEENQLPILYGHDINDPIGHAVEAKRDGNKIKLAGILSGYNVTPSANKVAGFAKNGFKWQASVGGAIRKWERAKPGTTTKVNGQTVNSEVLIVREFILKETSITAIGADDNTRAEIAAQQTTLILGETSMEFSAWLKAQGFDEATLTEAQKATLKAAYEATLTADADNEPVNKPVTAINLTASRKAEADEFRRVAAIRKICGTEHAELAATAIETGLAPVEVENRVLKARMNERPEAFFINQSKTPKNRDERVKQLTAAAMLSAGIKEQTILKYAGEQSLEAAYKIRQISLRELVAEAIRADGGHVPTVVGDGREYIEAATATTVVSLPNIMENLMHKTMLQAYNSMPIYAMLLGKVGTVKDYRAVNRYRMFGTGAWTKVTNGGELKNGVLGDEKFTNQADIWGQIITLTQKDIVDDDLGAFLQLPTQMGLQGNMAVDREFFTQFLDNATFFTSARKNYADGAATAFGHESLSAAQTLMRKMKVGAGTKESDKHAINLPIKFLLVPVELQNAAKVMVKSAVNITGENKTLGEMNPFENEFTVVAPPQLSDTYFSGSSEKAWYLLADPMVAPAIETVFLNNIQTPTITRVAPPPNTLGMGWAGVLNFGCNKQDYRGGVKMKGEA